MELNRTYIWLYFKCLWKHNHSPLLWKLAGMAIINSQASCLTKIAFQVWTGSIPSADPFNKWLLIEGEHVTYIVICYIRKSWVPTGYLFDIFRLSEPIHILNTEKGVRLHRRYTKALYFQHYIWKKKMSVEIKSDYLSHSYGTLFNVNVEAITDICANACRFKKSDIILYCKINLVNPNYVSA